MNRLLTVVFLLLIYSIPVHAQHSSPYQLDVKRELILGGIALGAYTSGYIIAGNIDPLTESDISTLNRSNIWGFDRGATKHFSRTAADMSNLLLYTSFAAPFALLSSKPIRKDVGKVGLLLAQAYFLNDGLTNITKGLVKRTRPYVYNESVPLQSKYKKTARRSFFSGHTSNVAMLTFFTAKVYSDYYPDSKYKPLVWTLATAIPIGTGLSRYYAGKHFPTDVIVGFGVGAAIGYLIPHIHKKKNRNFSLNPIMGLNGERRMLFSLQF